MTFPDSGSPVSAALLSVTRFINKRAGATVAPARRIDCSDFGSRRAIDNDWLRRYGLVVASVR